MSTLSRFTLLSFLLVGIARADYEEAVVTCDAKTQTLLIKYIHDSPDKGSKSKLPGHVVFWNLLKIEKCSQSDRYPGDPCRVVGTRRTLVSCELGEDRLTMSFLPEPFNNDLQGSCGAVVSGSVAIEKNGRAFLKATSFDPSGDCTMDKVKVISTIEVRSNQKEPMITWAERDDY